MTSENGSSGGSASNGTRGPFTDLGNAERFVAAHGQDVRYVPTWKSWLVWDGSRWKRDDIRELESRAKKTVRQILLEAQTYDEKKLRKECYKHAVDSEAAHKLRNMLTLAQAEPTIPIRPSALDGAPMYFNVANGTVDLASGSFRAARREDLLTRRSDVAFDSTADCPLWREFLLRIFEGDDTLIAYVQRAVGYTLTGETSEQCLHLLHGAGQNGKSTFLELIADLLGDYGMQADFTTFLDGKTGGPRDDIARLAGARMVRSSEVGEGKRLNESLVKSLTGQDTIAARFLYSETFEFRPQFKLWFAANHKPVIRGTDLAIWRRIRLVPFLVTIHPDDRDPEFANKLRRELPGILNWAVGGCLMWLREGLKPPQKVQAITDQYRAESDVLGAFLDECCVSERSAETGASDLYRSFKRWCDENGEYCPSQTHFGRKLDERGFAWRKTNGTKMRLGLKLQEAYIGGGERKQWFGRDRD